MTLTDIRLTFVLSAILFVGEGSSLCAAGESESSKTNGTEVLFMGQRVQLPRGGGDIMNDGRSGSKSDNEPLIPPHEPEDIFLDINGEKLTWRAIDRRIDMLLRNSPIDLPPEATVDQVNRVFEIARRKYAERLANRYVRDAVLAQKARESGLSISPNELAAAFKLAVKGLRGEKREEILKEAQDSESCFYREQENFLLSKKYCDTILHERITVSQDEVLAAITARNAEIETLTVSNAMMRPRMEMWLTEIREGKRDFGKTAYDFSDCPSSMEDGVMGDYERDDGQLAKPLWNFAFSATTNELSDVIETKRSVHILKVLSRKYGGDVEDDEPDDDEDDEDGEEVKEKVAESIPVSGNDEKRPTSVTLAQIMLEKHEIPMAMDEDAARVFVFKRKLGELSVAERLEAFKTAKIECAVPVTIFKNTEKRARKRDAIIRKQKVNHEKEQP